MSTTADAIRTFVVPRPFRPRAAAGVLWIFVLPFIGGVPVAVGQTNNTGVAGAGLYSGTVAATATPPLPDLNIVNREAVQKRLVPSPTVSLDESGGVVSRVVREPRIGSFLQMFSPFAPTAMGTGFSSHHTFSQAFASRSFRRDRSDEPVGLALFRWSPRREK